MNDLKIFGLGDSSPYADELCDALSMRRSLHTEEWRDDREPYVLSQENVRGCDVFIVSSLYSSHESLSDKFLKLILFARSLRDASARRISLIIPYLAFQRQDRKTESRAPVYTKYIPEIIEGLLRSDDRILTIDAHNLSAYQSGFRMMIDHLEAKPLIADWFSRNFNRLWPGIDENNMCFASPDDGGVERVGFYRKKVQQLMNNSIGIASVYKTHEGKNIKAHGVMGDVNSKDVFIGDDMISSGSTIVQAYDTLTSAGGIVRGVFATHGLFVGNASQKIGYLMDKNVKIIVTDTVHTNNLDAKLKENLIVVPTVGLFSEAIRCIHNEESISKLLN
jgi:ribose-phosphate pyrophosphokinase